MASTTSPGPYETCSFSKVSAGALAKNASTGIRLRGPLRRRSKLPERERSSSLASGLILAARAALEGDLAKGKGSLEARGLP